MSGDVMEFPRTPEEFCGQYSFFDKDEVYTNGSLLIPVFRVEQMVEHYFGRTCKVESCCAFSYDFSPEIYYEFKMQCGGSFDWSDEEPPNYCPNCGQKVEVDE